MRILLCNDDGIAAPGLAALEAALADLGEVWVVAPAKEHSAQSHAFTLHKPLRLIPSGERRYACSGTPADCAYLGLHGGLPFRPDLVVSGINKGSNLGTDVHYSGTVAAAREASFGGVPAIAVSLHALPPQPALHWETAQAVTRRVVCDVAARGLPPRTYLNVNVPDVPLDRLRGLAACPVGVRVYDGRVHRREDPWGRPYFWLGGKHVAFDDDPDTDGNLCAAGWATITPLHAFPTDHASLGALREWTDR